MAGLVALTLAFVPHVVAGQDPEAAPSSPDIRLTTQQRSRIDSIAAAFGAEYRRRATARPLTSAERRELHRRYRLQVAESLTPEQRARYLAWQAIAEDRFERRRP